jgi:ATP-dependent RNA helicase DHX37/DHR1
MQRKFDARSGTQSFQVSWISKASAAQRAGRAGRTGPGHCYRLYSSALYENHFDEFSMPEILRTPIEGIILQMKSMYIDAVVNFPFPTPPDRSALQKAEAILTNLGAIEPGAAVGKGLAAGGKITELGKSMALFPVNPRSGKMLATGVQHGCLPYVIALVSALSVGDPFLHEEVLDQREDDEKEDDIADLELVAEVAHIKREEIRAKEIRKAKRQAFFRSQQVGDPVSLNRHSTHLPF